MTIAKNWIEMLLGVQSMSKVVNVSLIESPTHRIQGLPEYSGVVCQVGATGRSRTA